MFLPKFKITPRIAIFLLGELCFFILSTKIGLEIFTFFFLLFASILGVDLLFLIITYTGTKKIILSREAKERLVEGDKLSLKLELYNRGRLPLFNVIIEDFLECADKDKRRQFILDWISPKSNLTLKYSCVCDRRGVYTLGPVKITSFDFLTFFYLERKTSVVSQIYVYPKTFNIIRTPPLVSGHYHWFGLEVTPASSGDHEFFALREYKPKDPIKRIHWFSTARKNKLIVKEYQRQSFYQVSILFVLNKETDIGEGKDKASEYMIKIVASLAKYFIKKDICVEIIAHTGRLNHLPPNKGAAHLEDILKFCAIAKAESRITLKEFLHEYSKYIYPNSTVFVLLLDKNLDDIVEMFHLKDRNVSVIPLILVSSTFLSSPKKREKKIEAKTEIVRKMDNLNVKALFFCKGDDLEEIFAKSLQ